LLWFVCLLEQGLSGRLVLRVVPHSQPLHSFAVYLDAWKELVDRAVESQYGTLGVWERCITFVSPHAGWSPEGECTSPGISCVIDCLSKVIQPILDSVLFCRNGLALAALLEEDDEDGVDAKGSNPVDAIQKLVDALSDEVEDWMSAGVHVEENNDDVEWDGRVTLETLVAKVLLFLCRKCIVLLA
jgi:hypothetical protein